MKEMKKHIIKLCIILVTLIVVNGCQKEYPIKFDSGTSVIGFNKSTLTIKENGTAGTVNLYLGAATGTTATDVTLQVSIEGIDNPAIEGTDFTLSSKSVSVGVGETAVTITPIDNSIFQGNKQFNLIITSNSKNYSISAQKTVTVTITDDEHPLKTWIGSYTVQAASYGKPGDWDEVWNVTTSAHPTDLTKLVVKGIGTSSPSTSDWIGVINTTDMTITFSPGQQLDEAYGYGPVLMYSGTPDGATNPDVNIVGTISANGDIHIDLLAIELTGANAGYVWDVFNTTWTKQ
jgi:hypothetical protein